MSLAEGKGGTYYPPFPVLGLDSDGSSTFLACGGGGSAASKEVPNSVQAFKWDTTEGKLSVFAALNTEKLVAFAVSHSAKLNLWTLSIGKACRMLRVNEAEQSITEVGELETELELVGVRKEIGVQNFAKFSPGGDLLITGGTDGQAKLWTYSKDGATKLVHTSEQGKEIVDAAFSADGKVVAVVDRNGECKLFDTCGEDDLGDEASNRPRIWWPTKGVITYQVPKVGKLQIKQVAFLGGDAAAPPQLLLSASGGRGPAFLGIFSFDGKKITEVKVGEKPAGCMATDAQKKHAMVALTTGEKKVYSLPKLKCIKASKQVHELPASCAAYLGDGACVTGSGDRSLHLMELRGSRAKGGSAWLSVMYVLLILIIVSVLVLRVGLQGAALGQGAAKP